MHTTIVSAEVLHDRLDGATWTIVDCRHDLADFTAGRSAYETSHIPGAYFAGVENDLSGSKTGSNGRHPMPDPETFARYLRSLGVGHDTQLVAYDAGGDMFAARFWFLCRWIGHRAVAVLDGGFERWTELGYPVTGALPVAGLTGSIQALPQAERLVDANYVLRNLETGTMQLLDARAADRFAGRNETVDPVAGHIPHARNRYYKTNFGEDGRFKTPAQLRAEFEAAGVDPKWTVHQCGSGVSAAVNLLAMEHAGLSGTRLYAGSWSEWIADPQRPIA